MPITVTSRKEGERDFGLKAAIRAILWAQGYTTRLNVLLAYDRQGRGESGKVALTDLDVLGVRLNPGFRIHTAVADCKTAKGQVPERLFWLSGVANFYKSDINLLVRSAPLPEHAPPLARSLGITLVGPDDLEILTNTYVTPNGARLPTDLQAFFSQQLLTDTLDRLSRLPSSLRSVSLYREARYWMDDPHSQLQRIISVLKHMARDGSRGPIYQLVFADFVWLYIIALWRACEALTTSSLSKPEQGLELYLSGNEAGLQHLQRMQQAFETVAERANVDVSLSHLPTYFKELAEIVVRCIRRPEATAMMARRAEWLTVGQIVGHLGPPPWGATDDAVLSDKLLGDVATFVVKASGLHTSFLDFYLSLLYDADLPEWITGSEKQPALKNSVAPASDEDTPEQATQQVPKLETDSGPEISPDT